MAGSLKRENPDIDEDVVLIRALRDSNLPKFLSDDALLFQVNQFTSLLHILFIPPLLKFSSLSLSLSRVF